MNTNSKLPEICGDALTRAREKFGLSIKELAARACLSTRQIQQLENGEQSSFYSAKIKVTAAKKVASLLGLTDDEVFDYGLPVSTKKIIDEQQEAQKLISSPAPDLEKPSELEVKINPAVAVNQVSASSFGSTKSKSPPQKRWLLWLSLVAVVVFSMVNLRTLFFPEKVAEMIVVKEEVIELASAQAPAEPKEIGAPLVTLPTVSAPVIAAQDTAGICPAEDLGVSAYKTEEPRKSADMVYVQAKTKQLVCVIDASGKSQNKTVEAGVGASFYGKPPFKVLTEGLAQVDIFFQGWKVRPVNLSGKTLILEPVELLTPASQASSEVR